MARGRTPGRSSSKSARRTTCDRRTRRECGRLASTTAVDDCVQERHISPHSYACKRVTMYNIRVSWNILCANERHFKTPKSHTLESAAGRPIDLFTSVRVSGLHSVSTIVSHHARLHPKLDRRLAVGAHRKRGSAAGAHALVATRKRHVRLRVNKAHDARRLASDRGLGFVTRRVRC